MGQTNEPKQLRNMQSWYIPLQQAQHARPETGPLLGQVSSFNAAEWAACMDTCIQTEHCNLNSPIN